MNADSKRTINTVIRLPVELHEKLRWLAYKQKRSQHSLIMEILGKELQTVQVPEDDGK